MKLRFPFKSLRLGLVLTYLFLIATSLGLLAWRIGASLDASRFAETKRDQEGRAILAASAAGDWLANYRDGTIDAAQLQVEGATLSREINQPVTILDARGGVLVDSDHTEQMGNDESNYSEVQLALSGSGGSIVRYDPDDKADALFSVAPIRFQKDIVGVIRLELSMALVQEASRQFWLRIIGATLLAAFVTAIVSLLFANALTQPIGQLTRAAVALANGDLKQRVHVNGPDELDRLAHSFNVMADRISLVMEDQRAFVANAAHELRTPLTTIRLRTEALADGAKDDPQVATQFLDDITNETDRLSRLVDELLVLSRLETGVIEPRRDQLALETIARLVIDQLAPRATQAGLMFNVAMRAGLPQVNVDPDQMRQVFINLIGNAIKFTPTGGTITIQMNVQKQPRDSMHLIAGNWLVTTIGDSGVGIPAEDLPRIFERFYRSDKARARGTDGGAGLGLAIVKSIIQAHHGQIWAASTAGVGTRITFALPLAKDLT